MPTGVLCWLLLAPMYVVFARQAIRKARNTLDCTPEAGH